jgi:hypothetical protein
VRVRRVWVFRAVFYGLAATAIALLLAGDRPQGADASGEEVLRGETGKGDVVSISLRDGRVVDFGITLRYRCDGSWFARFWIPRGAHLDQGVNGFAAWEAYSRRLRDGEVRTFWWNLGGRLEDGGDRASGTASVIAEHREWNGHYAVCESGEVRWSVER